LLGAGIHSFSGAKYKPEKLVIKEMVSSEHWSVALFILQVLFSEQVKLRNAITGNSLLERKTQHHHHHIDGGSPSVHEPSSSQAGSNPHILVPRLDGLNMGRVSLEESWQSARSEIKALHHEIATLKSKFSELEHEHYTGMSQQVSSSTIIIIY
jgi:hypothetical protein